MSVCTFIAADCPLKEVSPEKEYPPHINIDEGTIEDGGRLQQTFLLLFVGGTIFSAVRVNRYICCSCGFTEECECYEKENVDTIIIYANSYSSCRSMVLWLL